MNHCQFSVFVHPRAFWRNRFGGVTRYICELSRHLGFCGIEVQIPITDSPNEYLKHSLQYEEAKKIKCSAPFWIRWISSLLKNTRCASRAKRLELYFEALEYARRGQFDIVHPSDTYSVEIINYIKDKPLVVTVHDMIDEVYFLDRPGHQIVSKRKKIFVDRADAIIAISQHTKNDLIRLFNIPSEKIEVIYHGNSLKLPDNAENRQMHLPEQYILFVGTRGGYKNFITLVKAFSKISAQYPSLHLVCAGGGNFSAGEQDLFRTLGIVAKVEQMSVSDEELAIMYNRSQCFVFPSEYEGFGMPILEAFECGAPVICAQSSCFPEIAQDAAMYFPAHDVTALADMLALIISSPEEQGKLRQAGHMRVSEFSWSKAAEQTLRVYEKVLGKSVNLQRA